MLQAIALDLPILALAASLAAALIARLDHHGGSSAGDQVTAWLTKAQSRCHPLHHARRDPPCAVAVALAM